MVWEDQVEFGEHRFLCTTHAGSQLPFLLIKRCMREPFWTADLGKVCTAGYPRPATTTWHYPHCEACWTQTAFHSNITLTLPRATNQSSTVHEA